MSEGRPSAESLRYPQFARTLVGHPVSAFWSLLRVQAAVNPRQSSNVVYRRTSSRRTLVVDGVRSHLAGEMTC